MRVVLDTSVLVSAFIKPQGRVSEFVRAGLDGAFQICLSEIIIAETRQTLREGKRARRSHAYPDEAIDIFLRALTAMSVVVADLPTIEPVCRDPDDDHVLAAALAAKADCIVTGDKDLLVLGQYEGIRILTVQQAPI